MKPPFKTKRRPVSARRFRPVRPAAVRPATEAKPFQLSISPRAAGLLEEIGIPAETPFVPDPFQVESARLIEKYDVIVSAPTGSGKTWIAEQAMARELAAGGRAWYSSPLKALSNAKFLEFGKKFGPENVGLLTGDHKVNTDAPIIIGTTEILRNQLYDAMAAGRDLAADLVILDEAHYLGDPDRGVVWEEVLIYLPARVRLLLLSATVENRAELAAWLERNRGRPVRITGGGERPAPLHGLCLWPSGLVQPLEELRRAKAPPRPRRTFFQAQMPTSKIMQALRSMDLLPAIFFLKSRADCDAALGQTGPVPPEEPGRRAARQALVDDYVAKYPFLAEHPHLAKIRQLAVAAHHAGHLPHYKLMVEELMSRGLLSVIFATSTVSAGVNFPARTVVIRQSDRFDGQGFTDLTATEFTQMTGRAGRRGRDLAGFALMTPGPHLNLGLMAALMNAPPDPVESRLTINFSMVLNLLNAHTPEGAQQLLLKSLAAWQNAARRAGRRPTEAQLRQAAAEAQGDFVRHLNFLRAEGLVDREGRLTADGLWATELRLDHPLVFYAGIKARAWPAAAPLLAAAVAGLVADKEAFGPLPRRKPPAKLTGMLTTLTLAAAPMLDRLEAAGFAVPVFNLRPAWAMWHWATTGDFEAAVALLGLGDGDLAMLAMRTADHLRQLTGLPGQEELGRLARETVRHILKEPVSAPL